MSGRTTRRRFLAGAAGAGVVAATGVRASEAKSESPGDPSAYPVPGAVYPDPDEPWGNPFNTPIVGRLRSVRGRRVVVDVGADGLRPIVVAPDANIRTDSAARLDDFFPGELVAVEGAARDGGAFEATVVWSAVTTVVTRVRGVDGSVVETDDGRFVTTSNTRYYRSGGRTLSESAQIQVQLRTAPGRESVATAVKVL